MSSLSGFDPLSVATLRQIRTLIRNSSARGGVVFFALLYVLGSVFAGGMLVLGNIQGGYTETILWSGGPGTNPWNYPGLLIIAPWGVISLPFFATIAMLVVSVGVGFGMTVAFLLALQLVRSGNRRVAGSTSVGAVAGLTPAMISLVTLGACCSTTAAATAGVGLVAQASGTTASNLLLNNWYLGVFQIVVVWVALIAQELLLVIYAGLFGQPGGTLSASESQKVDVRFVAGALMRVALLVGGVLWSLSMVAEWTTVNPATASAGLWFQWVVQHQVVAGLAVAAAFFPTGTFRLLRAARSRYRPRPADSLPGGRVDPALVPSSHPVVGTRRPREPSPVYSGIPLLLGDGLSGTPRRRRLVDALDSRVCPPRRLRARRRAPSRSDLCTAPLVVFGCRPDRSGRLFHRVRQWCSPGSLAGIPRCHSRQLAVGK